MNKFILCFILSFFFSTAVTATKWGSWWKSHSHYYKEHIEITPELNENYRVKAGESAQFKGMICLRDKKEAKKKWKFSNYFKRFKDDNGCKRIHDSDQFSKHEIRFFFPDTNTEVTEQVELIGGKNALTYTFNTTEINADLANKLTVVVKERDFYLRKYLKYQAKVQRHIELIERLKEKHKHKKFLERYLAKLERILVKLEAKIAKRMEEDPRVYARLDYPVQVDNKITAPVEYTKVVSGFKLSLSSKHGVHFAGEQAKISAKVMNLNEKEDDEKGNVKEFSNGDKYKWKYWAKLSIDDVELAISEKSLLRDFNTIEFDVITKELSASDLNRLRLEFFRGKEVPKWAKSYSYLKEQSWGEVNYKLDVQEDSIAPLWSDDSTLTFEYAKDKGHVTLNISDELGRVDFSSFSVELDHTDLAGAITTTSILDKVEFTAFGNMFSDGVNIGADKYQLVIDLTALAEGDYKLKTKAADFSGNESETLENSFAIDKTVPVISINQADNQLTNNPSFSIAYDVVDRSPVVIKLTHNGVEYSTTDQESGIFDILLVEGNNTFEVSAVDAAGNLAEVVKLDYIKLDTNPPEIALTKPIAGETIRTLDFVIEGQVSEELSSLIIDEKVLTTNLNYIFSTTSSRAADGDHQFKITATDLAGNSSELTFDFTIVTKLLIGELISVVPQGNKLCIKGTVGSTRPGVDLNVSLGIFNDYDLSSNPDGSFMLEVDYFTSAKITATDDELDREETHTITFEADTTFSGVVKNIYDQPLPGVTVTIASSGQSAITDSNGVFYINDPVTGDQAVTVDGSTIPVEVTTQNVAYASMTLNYTFGNLQANVVEDIIYMTPLFLDTATEVIADQETIVTSPHAEGVTLRIPAGAVESSGEENIVINIMEIPADKVAVKIPDFLKPDSVLALGPAGLSFKERVEVTLPNPNEFPVGMELVVMSKSSETGYWSIDGTASVTGTNEIKTHPGQGISHFSEIFVAPYGLSMKEFGDQDKPGIHANNGGAKLNISLPSFKVRGNDITPQLHYDSSWASPNAIISSRINVPNFKVRMNSKISRGNTLGKVTLETKTKMWAKPEYLKSKFRVAGLESEDIYFNIKGLPTNTEDTTPYDAFLSYSMPLTTVPDGLYFAEATYEMKYRFFQQTSFKQKSYSLGSVETERWKSDAIDEIKTVFPEGLQTLVYQQNKMNSEAGRGWKLGLTQRILNPGSNRLVLEEESGSMATYGRTDTIETLVYNENGIKSANLDFYPNITYATDESTPKIKEHNIGLGDAGVSSNLTRYGFAMGFNALWKRQGSEGFFTKFTCEKMRLQMRVPKDVQHVLKIDENDYLAIDALGSLVRVKDGSMSYGAGNYKGPGTYYYEKTRESGDNILVENGNVTWNDRCQHLTGYNCANSNNQINDRTHYQKYTVITTDYYRNHNFPSDCNKPDLCYSGNCTTQFVTGSGRVPLTGYKYSGNLFENTRSDRPHFNNPNDFLVGNASNILYMADTGNHRIVKIDLASNKVSRWAGNGSTSETKNESGKNRLDIRIRYPRGLTKDNQGNIYFVTSPSINSSIRGHVWRIGPTGKATIIAGQNSIGTGDDTEYLDELSLIEPHDLAFDSNKNYLYVADTGANRIVRLDLNPDKRIATHVGGEGGCAYNEADVKDGKPATLVTICRPKKIGLDEDGDLLVLDSHKKRVRRINFDVSDGLNSFGSLAQDNSSMLKNADGTYERIYRDGSKIFFDALGRQVSSVDKVGNSTSFGYTDGFLDLVTFPTGQTLEMSYLDGTLSSIKDPAGRMTYFDIIDGVLEKVRYAADEEVTQEFTYNADGQITEHYDMNGNLTKYDYTEWKRLASVTKVHPNDSSKNVKTQISHSIEDTIANDAISEANPKEIDSYGEESDNELADVFADAEEYETKLKKDMNGYYETITDSKERVTTIERDSEGRPLKITRYDDSFTQFTYNEFGDLVTKFDSETNRSEGFKYNADGNLTEYTNTLNNTKKNSYYADTGLLRQETDYNGNKITRSYYADGLLEKVYNDLLEETLFQYDDHGNLSYKRSPLGEETIYTRDDAGNIISKVNANSEETQYGYDHFNRLTMVITGVQNGDPSTGKMTTYSYDENGNLKSIIDPEANETKFSYDFNNRLIEKITPLNQVTNLEYDRNGNVQREVDPNGNIKTFEYDSDNQLTKKILPDNVYEMKYDLDGNMEWIADLDSRIEFSYEKIDKDYYVSETIQKSSYYNDVVLSYSYDELGNREEMLTPWGSFSYGYDNGNRLTSVTNHKSEVFEFGYDAANRLKTIDRLGGQVVSSFSFDKNSFLESILHRKGSSTTVNDYLYTRDSIGNRKSVSTSRGIASYGYDDESQLKTVTNTEVSGDYASESFNYDDLGNRLNDQLGNFVYDNKSQRLTEDYKHTYTYDNNGNMTGVQVKGMTGTFRNLNYSSENQLTSIDFYENNVLVKQVDYKYDALGRRMAKLVTDNQNSSNSFTRKYIYDGQEILAELDENDTTLGVYTHSTLRTDDVLAVDVKSTKLANATGSYFYLKDALGSVVDIVDSSGSLIQHYAYSSFGKIVHIKDSAGVDVTANAPVKTSYGFTNREHDEESGMMYFRARFMMPEIGRFIQEDPHPGFVETPSTINSRYVYTGNDPVNKIDPNGEWWQYALAITISIIASAYDSYENSDGENVTIGFNANFSTDGEYQDTETYVSFNNQSTVYYNTSYEQENNVLYNEYLYGQKTDVGIQGFYPEMYVLGVYSLRSYSSTLWNNRYLRIGYGRKGGDYVYRISIGNKSSSIHKHLDLKNFGKLKPKNMTKGK